MVDISINRGGNLGVHSLSRSIIDNYTSKKFIDLPEIGHSVDLIKSSVSVSVGGQVQSGALEWSRTHQDKVDENLKLFLATTRKPLWVELVSENQIRGVILAPNEIDQSRLSMCYWILANGAHASMIPILSDWCEIDGPGNHDIPSPERGVVFRETPGTKKLMQIAIQAGEIPKSATVQDLCVPVMHMGIRALVVLANMIDLNMLSDEGVS